MLKSLGLFFVSLLTYGCTSNSGIVNNDYCNNSNDSYVSRLVLPQMASNSPKIRTGTYNWRDEPLYEYIDDLLDFTSQSYTLTFEESNEINFLVPTWCYFSNNAGNGYRYCYTRNINIVKDDDNSISFRFSLYDSNQGVFTYVCTWYENYVLDDLSSNDFELMINFRNDYVFDNDILSIFNCFFTTGDNAYIESYNGFYNFTTGISHLYSPLGVFGYLTFNNRIYLGFTNTYGDGSSTHLRFDCWDIENEKYVFQTYDLPFDKNVVVYNNMLISSAKIPSSVKTYMSQVGIFSYVRDVSYDNADFHDLLFSIADTPLYFITRLLDWQLFGMNLFIAFAGLLTVAIVLVCIRRFF